MYFQYDTSGAPLGFIYNGTQYFYMTNQMGDVISITDNQGNELVQYEYDEWGKCNSISLTHEEDGIVANANPIRYRGYYLDSETGYYYLRNRYYDSDICRFINSDEMELNQITVEIKFGTNMCLYCCNDPINHVDLYGYWKDAVHNGYNPNTYTKYNNVKVNNKTYFYGTYYWAIQCGFSKNDAYKLGLYCADLDNTYPSTTYSIMLAAYSSSSSNISCPEIYKQLADAKSWQYYHFNGYKSGNNDTRYEYACQKRREAVKYWKSNHDYALKMLGYGLHAIQDMCAHGQIGRGNSIPQHITSESIRHADEMINYVWTNNSTRNSLRKSPGDLSRLFETQRLTYTFLKAFLGGV